jgi:hypothetical protein
MITNRINNTKTNANLPVLNPEETKQGSTGLQQLLMLPDILYTTFQ